MRIVDRFVVEGNSNMMLCLFFSDISHYIHLFYMYLEIKLQFLQVQVNYDLCWGFRGSGFSLTSKKMHSMTTADSFRPE